jgi:hypothetical protein
MVDAAKLPQTPFWAHLALGVKVQSRNPNKNLHTIKEYPLANFN